ncbi:hypothetical protein Kfla_6257 [Kribbella flavida DSM 17836]|uniref:Uncharacterized protein n=2 Tax=Kribbella flavida TaxID=182640 RepID=D2PVM0_KRIFD|nr:hypothetical protein Kfla_6257 [Kribbella flavida DSM 17836]
MLLVLRFRRAQQVFDGLVSSVDHRVHEADPPRDTPPEHGPQIAPRPGDELSRRRGRRHPRPTLSPHTVHRQRTGH